MQKILFVEDSEEYQKIVSRTLGHLDVVCAADTQAAWEQLQRHHVDLILLDIQLPGKDGYSLLTELQSHPEFSSIPVMCLTGRSAVTDKITAFSLGAEDYIVKPFDPLEFRARIDARLTRVRQGMEKSQKIVVGALEIDQARHRVWIQGTEDGTREITLTQTEFKLLTCLARRPDQIYSRDQLLVAVWGEDADVLDRVVDVHICSLRKKIGGAFSILSVTGFGYKLSMEKPQQKRKAA